jgi:hypothetical protein
MLAAPFDFPAHLGGDVGHYANARYHIPAIYLACGLAGLGVAAIVRVVGRALPERQQLAGSGRAIPLAQLVALAIVVAAAAPGFGVLRRMWAPQIEYEVFRGGLERIGPDCRVVTLLDVSDAGFVPFPYLAPGRMLDIGDYVQDPQDGCAAYYRAGNCYSARLVAETEQARSDMHPACATIERTFELEPILETQVAALAYRGEVYLKNPLPVGFYWLHPRRTGRDGSGR